MTGTNLAHIFQTAFNFVFGDVRNRFEEVLGETVRCSCNNFGIVGFILRPRLDVDKRSS